MMAPEMVLETVELMKTATEKGVLANLIINNRAGGNAPIIAQIIAKKFMPKNQDIPPFVGYCPLSKVFELQSIILVCLS